MEVIHIYSSTEEMEDIFKEALLSLSTALELFMMIEKQDSTAEIMAERTYDLFKLGEDILNGHTPNE